MEEDPNEQSTLLAKNRTARNYTDNGNTTDDVHDETPSPEPQLSGTAVARSISSESELSEFEFEFRWNPFKYYLVELVMLILLFAYNLSSTIMKNQIIYQTCVTTFSYTESECKLLGTKNANNHTRYIETVVQPYVARIIMCTSCIENIVPAILALFIGAWSDRFGRKPLLVLSFSGFALYYAIAATITQFATVKLVSPWYYLLPSVPQSLTGGSITCSVGVFCYISDVSSRQERPYRWVLYESAVLIGLMSGSLASGYIYEATNSVIVFLLSAGAIMLALFVIILFIPESLHLRRNVLLHNESDDDSISSGTEIYHLGRIFDWDQLKEMFWTCFKPRQFNDRAIIWLAIASLLISIFVIDGSMNVFYLFIRNKFHWTIQRYTLYDTFSICAAVVGNLLGIWLLRKIFKISIVNLGILAFLCEAASSLLKGLAMYSWQLYVAIGIGALKSMAHPMCRTIITNLAPATELGKIFSFLLVLQSIVPLIASPAYISVYSLTLTTFPGCFNILSAVLYLIVIGCLLLILQKKVIFPEHYELLLNGQ